MNYKTKYILGLFAILLWQSCTNAPDFTDAPVIEFVSFSESTVPQTSGNQFPIDVIFRFEDGDGDLGVHPDSNKTDIIFIDNRTGQIEPFRSPFIPESGVNNGIQGEIKITVFSTCCIFPPETQIPPCSAPELYPTNDLSFDISITDRAGNVSNVITTPNITLLCN